MPRMPVLFIPGYPGSELRAATGQRLFPPGEGDLVGAARDRYAFRIRGPFEVDAEDGVVASDVVRTVEILGLPLFREADTLISLLTRGLGYTEGEDFRVAPWDWRLPVYSPAVIERVRFELRKLAEDGGGGPVAIIAHSTGGLVFRALLEESTPEQARELSRLVGKVIALGVPWAGLLKTLRYIGVGKREKTFTRAHMRTMLGHSWAAWDLMPPDPDLSPLTLADGSPLNLFVDHRGEQKGPLADTGWIRRLGGESVAFLARAGASHRALGERTPAFRLPDDVPPIPVVNVAGWGARTDCAARLDRAGTAVRMDPPSELGDGTVPLVSATWLRGPAVRTVRMPVGLFHAFRPRFHSQLWDTEPVGLLLRRELTGEPIPEIVDAALDSDDVANRNQVVVIRVVALDPEYRPLPDAEARLAHLPDRANFRLRLAHGFGEIRWRRGTLPPSGLSHVRVIVSWTGPDGPSNRVIDRFF